MKSRFLWLLLFLITCGLISGCSPKAKYERRLKHELASGVRNDSLFMGLYFGMPEKEFYLHCWDLNKKGLIKQGSANTTVEYEMNTGLKYPCYMNFYPRFYQGKIFEMPVTFKYKSWAPWDKKYFAENLQEDVLRWYEKVYGGGFIEVQHPERGKAYIKLDGNRRITIFKKDDIYVCVIFTDMLAKKNPSDIMPDPLNNQNELNSNLQKR